MIEATIRLMSKTGFHGFTLADVGEHAGYSRGLPAHYFGRKDELLSAVARSIVDAFRLEIEMREGVERGLPRISGWIINYAERVTSPYGAVLAMLLTESMIRDELRRTLNELDERGLETLAEELDAGIQLGNVKLGLDVLKHAKIIFAFMRGLLSFATHNPEFDQVSLAREFVETWLFSISSTQ